MLNFVSAETMFDIYYAFPDDLYVSKQYFVLKGHPFKHWQMEPVEQVLSCRLRR